METKTEEKASIILESFLTCIDLTNPNLHQSALSLKQACLDCGFFYVINHGISEEITENTFEQSRKFFDLDLEEKMKVLKNEKHRGYTPLYDQIPDPENQVHGSDHKEGYYIGTEVSRDDPHWDKPFYGPNPWPDPDVLPRWRETMEKYHQEALRVCKAIAKLLALALDLDVDYFDSPEMLGKPISTMRLLHYQGISDPSKGIYGTGAHSDYGMLTLLATDGVMGLQICKDRNAKPQKWEYVPSIKGTIVVNLGDMMERWSNGLFKSTLHRVLMNGQNRYSIPFFVEPSHDCIIECLPTCKSENNLPKYLPITCEVEQLQKLDLSEVYGSLPTIKAWVDCLFFLLKVFCVWFDHKYLCLFNGNLCR